MANSNYTFYLSIVRCNTNINPTISQHPGLTKSYHKVVLRSYLLDRTILAFKVILNKRFSEIGMNQLEISFLYTYFYQKGLNVNVYFLSGFHCLHLLPPLLKLKLLAFLKTPLLTVWEFYNKFLRGRHFQADYSKGQFTQYLRTIPMPKRISHSSPLLPI